MWICNEMYENSQRLLQRVLLLVFFWTQIAVGFLAPVPFVLLPAASMLQERNLISWDLICYPEIVVTASFRCYVSLSALTYRNTCETLTDTWSKLSVWFITPANLRHAIKPRMIFRTVVCVCVLLIYVQIYYKYSIFYSED